MNQSIDQSSKVIVDINIYLCASAIITDLIKGDILDDKDYTWGTYDSETDDFVEISEHWFVSDWLARQLRKQGEIVNDYNIYHVWCRVTSGQAIWLDGVIQEIAKSIK